MIRGPRLRLRALPCPLLREPLPVSKDVGPTTWKRKVLCQRADTAPCSTRPASGCGAPCQSQDGSRRCPRESSAHGVLPASLS